MSKFQPIILAAAAALFVWLLRPALGEAGFEALRQKAVAANPAGVSVTLAVAGGKTVFHRGEMIPLTAAFAASTPGRYDLNTDPGSRDLQWGSDAFHCDSAGATDPLRVYYDREFGTVYSGPGPRFQPLTTQPAAIGYTLNEWLRFDVPGHYRVYLTSGRVVDAAKRHNDLLFQGHLAASNTVEFDVLPDDPAWNARTLQNALPLFNDTSQNYRAQEAGAVAARTVRFLGTPDAVQAMVARCGSFTGYDSLNTSAYYQTQLGLLGFPDRAFVIGEMQRRLADPNFPIFTFFLDDLAEAQFLAAYPQTVPPYAPNDPVQNQQRQDKIGQRIKALTEFNDQARLALAAAVPAKQGRAKALSLFTLLQNGYQNPHTPAQRELAQALIPVFDDLTPDEQGSLLSQSGYWKEVRGPDMLPILRRVYAAPLPNADPDSAQGFDARERQSLALHDLMELSPAGGRALLLAEIANPKTTIDLATLCSLPDQFLPSLDKTFALNLENSLSRSIGDSEVESRLVERYATRAILPRLKAEHRFYGCVVDVNLLAYFLRTDPAYGAAQLEQALARRKDTGCYRYVLSDVAGLHYGPEVERLALLHLHDPDPQTAADAAKTLGAYGSPAAEASLWARMREWHKEWAGKADQLEPTDKNSAPAPGQLEFALTQALATAPGWLLDAPQLRTLEALCVTPQARINVTAMVLDPSAPVFITGGGADEWGVAQYDSLPSLSALEHKLAQFPAGTRFRLSRANFTSPDAQALTLSCLHSFLEKRRMTLTAEPFPVR